MPDDFTHRPTASEFAVLLFESEPLHRLEEVLWRHAHVAELSLVNLSHQAMFVHENTRGKSDVLAVPTTAMSDVELVEELTSLVGEEGELGAELPAKTFRDFRRIDTNRENARVGSGDSILEFLELPELTRAKRSARAPIEENERRLAVEAHRVEELAVGVTEREAREAIPHPERDFAPRKAGAARDVPNDHRERDELDGKQADVEDARALENRRQADEDARADEHELLVGVAAIRTTAESPLKHTPADE